MGSEFGYSSLVPRWSVPRWSVSDLVPLRSVAAAIVVVVAADAVVEIAVAEESRFSDYRPRCSAVAAELRRFAAKESDCRVFVSKFLLAPIARL